MLLSKTPEAVNDIPETSTNETITLGIASTSLDEMPSTEKDRNETLKQIRLLEKKCADRSKMQFQSWKTKIKHFSQMSSHLVGLPLMRQCHFIQVFLTTKYSWHPLNI